MSRRYQILAAAAATVLACTHARATMVTLADDWIQLENDGNNDIGFRVGYGIFLGADTSPGLAGIGTTATASTIDTISGTLRSFRLPFDGNIDSKNLYDTSVADGSGLHGPWTLTFTNGTDTTSYGVSLPPGATQLPAIGSLAISGTPANPTFSWSPPTSASVEGYKINLFDQGLLSENRAHAAAVLARSITCTPFTTCTSFTIPSNLDGGLPLDPRHTYTIQVNAVETRDGSVNLSNPNVFARSRAYFDFTPAAVPGGHTFTYLPTIGANGAFDYFVTDITAGTTIFIDPPIATGYLYAIGAGDPNFRSVVLPTGIGDGKYDIYGFSAEDHLVLLAKNWIGGDIFDFGAAGISEFEVRGIETSAMLNPSSTLAFVTGLTFTGNGNFTGTQTPITTNVPEPSGIGLFALGALTLAAVKMQPRRAAG